MQRVLSASDHNIGGLAVGGCQCCDRHLTRLISAGTTKKSLGEQRVAHVLIRDPLIFESLSRHMFAHQILTPPTVPSSLKSTEKFTCGRCETARVWCGSLHWCTYPVPEQEIWKVVFEAADQNQDFCKVKCPNPNCSLEHLQCTHCNKSILVHDNAVLKRSSRSA